MVLRAGEMGSQGKRKEDTVPEGIEFAGDVISVLLHSFPHQSIVFGSCKGRVGDDRYLG